MGSTVIFDLFLAAIGVYVLIAGIMGKGRMYTTQRIKEGCEEKIMVLQRWCYVAIGAAMLVNGASSAALSLLYNRVIVDNAYQFEAKPDMALTGILSAKLLTVLTFVFMFLSVIAIVVLIVGLKKMTDRPEKKKSEKGRPAAPAYRMPSAAFSFDEEGTDVKKGKKK